MADKTILIIDDDPEILTVTQARLQAGGFRVVTSADGEEGCQKALHEQPDLILLDIKMPHVDGYTLVKKLKREDATKTIPLMVFTAYKDMKELFALEGIEDYIVKPFNPLELLAKVKDCLEGAGGMASSGGLPKNP